MKVRVSLEPCTRCWVTVSIIMILRRSSICATIEDIAEDFAQKILRCRTYGARNFRDKQYPSTVVLFIVMAVSLQSMAYGQAELGYRDLFYPDRLVYASLQSHQRQDPLKQARSLTTRAAITVAHRDQSRHLTVFRASTHGHVEFGFPTSENRPSGSLEIFDATRISSHCCPTGIRMVALRHVCSDSYLAVDGFGQMRACQLSDDGSFTTLRRERHCLDGERIHRCTESPYFYLDHLSRMITQNSPGSLDTSQPGRYKLRFERKPRKKVFYASVTPTTWEFKLRSQNSIIRRATVEACQTLWHRSIHVLFERKVTSYKIRRVKRNFREFRSLCDIDPAVIRDYIVDNVSMTQFSDAVESAWSKPIVDILASSIAWSRMSAGHKKVFVLIAAKIVKDFLRDSLLEVTSLHCLSKTPWGRLSRESRIRRLDKSLTLSWIQRRTEATELVLNTMERSIDSRTTTFLISEEG